MLPIPTTATASWRALIRTFGVVLFHSFTTITATAVATTSTGTGRVIDFDQLDQITLLGA